MTDRLRLRVARADKGLADTNKTPSGSRVYQARSAGNGPAEPLTS